MCCQDRNATLWQMLYEAAGWSAEAESSFLGLGQWALDELPTAAAEVVIEVGAG